MGWGGVEVEWSGVEWGIGCVEFAEEWRVVQSIIVRRRDVSIVVQSWP